ncbi:uncharacterized protein [Dipodomys merriami]|uniref:uncharacterized protein n=1 Tax=Dipodomys merriami TaxID=94247 RepID=UPI003855964E
MDRLPVVCDYGSGFSKVGFAGNKDPLGVFPTVLGKFRHDRVFVGMEEQDWFIGSEVYQNLEKLNLHYPISRGAINSWDDLEKIWHYSFYHLLHSNPKEHPLMLSEPPLIPFSVKEITAQILFETFNVPALHLANPGVLAMFASGQTSGTTIESGEGMTCFVPVIDGCPLNGSTTKLDIAGQDLTFHLMHLLDRGNLLLGTADRECIRIMKEKCCFVAQDFDKEKESSQAPSQRQTFQLPDGREVSLGHEAFLCPEALFQTSLIDLSPKKRLRPHPRVGQAPGTALHTGSVRSGSNERKAPQVTAASVHPNEPSGLRVDPRGKSRREPGPRVPASRAQQQRLHLEPRRDPGSGPPVWCVSPHKYVLTPSPLRLGYDGSFAPPPPQAGCELQVSTRLRPANSDSRVPPKSPPPAQAGSCSSETTSRWRHDTSPHIPAQS